MTRQEASMLLAVLAASYPKYYKGMTDQEKSSTIDVWTSVLEDYTYQQASRGLRAFLSSDTEGFPPSPGQVIDCIRRVSATPKRNALEAWALVSKALRNSTYNSTEEFKKLPRDVQRAVGHPDNLREWATTLTEETVNSVAQAQFIKSYMAVQKEDEDYAKIPMSIRQAVATDEIDRVETQKTAGQERLATEWKSRIGQQADTIDDELPEVM